MTSDAELAELARVEEVLNTRWPETRIEPSLDRISHLMNLLGDPQLSYPVIHITGTNGKSSTARMIESLLRSRGLTTGLVTSPHLHSITERIQVNGQPITPAKFVAAYDEIEPFLAIVDAQSLNNDGPAMSYFEVLTGLAFAVFADLPVEVAIVEVGMGGRWDATNVVQPEVSVITPIGLDHMEYLGDTITQIAGEKAGIIKAGSIAVLAKQPEEAESVLTSAATALEVPVVREGVNFGVLSRSLAMGGQVIELRGLTGDYEEILLPLYGEHQAANASLALAAVEAFFGGIEQMGADQISEASIKEAFSTVSSPGRLEVVRRSPTVLVDAAHNPHGAEVLAKALAESFDFISTIGVISIMADKDVDGILTIFEGIFDQIIVTHNGAARAMSVAELQERAAGILGADRVATAPDIATAIAAAVDFADEAGTNGIGIVVTGSVVTSGVARALVRKQ
ncbi:MAG: bifunctional folylpolyglutamate synthase/dihydrofolate synthase [Actinomycetales bacterium]|nr:bifunctional folylpolyglutamate synthase/dihydrofolate synthase [Actinomycetales bacterium]